ncbi:unnamed protein product [Phaeothamnion confervicola]
MEDLQLESACRGHLEGLNIKALCQLEHERTAAGCPGAGAGAAAALATNAGGVRSSSGITGDKLGGDARGVSLGGCAGVKGMVAEYSSLPDIFTEHIYPEHFGMRKLMEERGDMAHMLRAGAHYSKQSVRIVAMSRNATAADNAPPFEVDDFKTGMDKDTKAEGANGRMRDEARAMCPAYNTLRTWQQWRSPTASPPPGPSCEGTNPADAWWGDVQAAVVCPQWAGRRHRQLAAAAAGGAAEHAASAYGGFERADDGGFIGSSWNGEGGWDGNGRRGGDDDGGDGSDSGGDGDSDSFRSDSGGSGNGWEMAGADAGGRSSDSWAESGEMFGLGSHWGSRSGDSGNGADGDNIAGAVAGCGAVGAAPDRKGVVERTGEEAVASSRERLRDGAAAAAAAVGSSAGRGSATAVGR